MNEKEEKINFIKLINAISVWSERLEKRGLEWSEQDWISWGRDITDSIIDIYTYLKSMGILFNGLNELLHTPKEESENEIDKKNNINHLYS